LPLAATVTTEEVYAAFLGRPEDGRTFYHGHTYTGNPLGAAAALASLELFEQTALLETLPTKCECLGSHLRRMAKLPCVGEVRQRGRMAGIELVEDWATKRPFPSSARTGARVCRAARDRGVLLRPLGDVIVIMPPLAIELPLLDRLCDVVYECLAELSTV